MISKTQDFPSTEWMEYLSPIFTDWTEEGLFRQSRVSWDSLFMLKIGFTSRLIQGHLFNRFAHNILLYIQLLQFDTYKRKILHDKLRALQIHLRILNDDRVFRQQGAAYR